MIAYPWPAIIILYGVNIYNTNNVLCTAFVYVFTMTFARCQHILAKRT